MKGKDVLLIVLFIAGSAAVNLIPPNHPDIQYVGRVDTSNPQMYTFEWASVHIYASFAKSSSVSVQFQDTPGTVSYWGDKLYYEVYIDNELVLELNTSTSNLITYTIAQNLTGTQHNLVIARRVEAVYGLSGFVGIVLDDGGVLVPPAPRPDMRIEFLGDSITCGWGTEGTAPCTDQPQLENSEKTWAAVAAKAIGADYSVISWSGQGMVRYYGCPNITCPGALPSLYPRTLGQEASPLWNFSSWIPQAVVINLGTNDYGSKPFPPTDVFVAGYTNFVLNQVLPPYGKNVTVFTACYFAGPMCENVQAAYENLVAMGVNAVYVPFSSVVTPNPLGCDGHPDVAEQANWGAYLTPIIKTQMGW